jgi:phosphomannomutase/phosphoglucomutase
MKSIFREYDIRGIFAEDLNKNSIYWIGYFLGQEISRYGNYVAVGYDARIHSPNIFDLLAEGLNASNITVLDMGMVPTPNNYFANYTAFELQKKDIDRKKQQVTPNASIMITGSHNPPEYNGFKITINKAPFFGESIYKLGDLVINALKNKREKIFVNPKIIEIDAKEKYIFYLINEFAGLKNFDKKITYDVGNGVAGVVIDEVFKLLNINAKGIYTEPNGVFPNHHPDPSEAENLKDLQALMKSENSDIGFAYDGDADRIAVLTQQHNIKGDILALLLSKNMENPYIIGEVKCSQVMYDLVRKRGGEAVMYKTGHSNLKVKLKELEADLAAEVSGHIFFNDRYFGYDDAIYTTLRVLELLKNGMDLNKEVALLPKTYSTEEIKIQTTEENKFLIIQSVKKLLQTKEILLQMPNIKEIITVDGLRIVFDKGWGLIRASNTSPYLVARFESTEEKLVVVYQNAMLNLLKKIELK